PAAAAARSALVPDGSGARQLRPDRRAARPHLAREPGQADLRRPGAPPGAFRAGRGKGALTRVLFLTESFHPTLGGGETHVRRLGAALVAAGDAATVVTRRADAAWPAEETLDGVRVLRVGAPGPARTGKYRMLPAAFRAARRELARHDVLVVRGTRVLGLPGLLAARTQRRPVVLQPEINGELSGEAFTWGKPWAAGLPGAVVRGAVD